MSSTIRHAIRRLLRERTLTITAVLTLALGIGATTAVFTVVNAVLLQPLAYPRPEWLAGFLAGQFRRMRLTLLRRKREDKT